MDFYRAIKVNFGTPVTAEGFVWTEAITGAPTGGTFLLLVDGVATAAIAYNATNDAIASALDLLDGVAGVTVTGTTTKTITFTEDVLLTKDVTGFTGGTTPNITLVNVS
jgi:hypothetical protein